TCSARDRSEGPGRTSFWRGRAAAAGSRNALSTAIPHRNDAILCRMLATSSRLITDNTSTSLENDLRAVIPRGEVRFDRVARALYATDASPYRLTPLGVVVPRDLDEVRAAVAVAARHGAPILARGGGTSLAGQTVAEAVVIDMSKHLTAVLDLNVTEG